MRRLTPLTAVVVGTLAGSVSAQPFHTVGWTDDLETYNTGALAGQGQWYSEGTVSFQDATVLDAGFGDRTISIGVSVSRDRALKLLGMPVAFGRLDFDVRLSDIGQGKVELIEDSTNVVVAYLGFQPGHQIRTRNRGSSFTFDTGASYIPNATNRIGMEVLPNGVVNYYLNGNLFYVGEDLSNVDAGLNHGFDQFEFTNEQFSSGSIYIDNLEIVASDFNPCPPDVNGDGFLDNGDIALFITLFLAGDISVDFNGDSLLDNGDIAAFIEAFLAGC